MVVFEMVFKVVGFGLKGFLLVFSFVILVLGLKFIFGMVDVVFMLLDVIILFVFIVVVVVVLFKNKCFEWL